jgi:hypothetical protein
LPGLDQAIGAGSAKKGKFYFVDREQSRAIAERFQHWPQAAIVYFGILVSPCKARREFHILDHVRPGRKQSGNYWAQCPSCARHGRDHSKDNLAISVADPRKYKCWAGCSKEMIRAAIGQPIRTRNAETA